VGGLGDLFNPYALLGGAATLLLFVTHGAVFLALKTEDDVRDAARRLAIRLGVGAVVAVGAFLLWTDLGGGAAVAIVALIAALALTRIGRDGWAFAATGVTVVAATATLFLALYPNVLPSTLDPANSLTVTNAASSPYTLKIMTWVALAFTPVVLMYQGWTYWVFRKRIGVRHIPRGTH
jgi:cytochrome d ubiquinol oxidase subunit II